LPEPGIDVLHIGLLGHGLLFGRRPAALERYLMRHEVGAGRDQQNPDEAVATDVRNLLL